MTHTSAFIKDTDIRKTEDFLFNTVMKYYVVFPYWQDMQTNSKKQHELLI